MRKKRLYKQLVHQHPDRLFVLSRDHSDFRPWLDQLRQELPLVLELGMGKGDFLLHQARLHPEYFFLGIEIKEDRIYKAYRKAIEAGQNNIAFLQSSVEKLSQYDFPAVEEIYMLFPDPWPKKRHSRRRMTSEAFLQLYQDILSPKGTFVFKTDNETLYEYSRENLMKRRWRLTKQDTEFQTEIGAQTAYEKHFRLQQKKIFYLKAQSH